MRDRGNHEIRLEQYQRQGRNSQLYWLFFKTIESRPLLICNSSVSVILHVYPTQSVHVVEMPWEVSLFFCFHLFIIRTQHNLLFSFCLLLPSSNSKILAFSQASFWHEQISLSTSLLTEEERATVIMKLRGIEPHEVSLGQVLWRTEPQRISIYQQSDQRISDPILWPFWVINASSVEPTSAKLQSCWVIVKKVILTNTICGEFERKIFLIGLWLFANNNYQREVDFTDALRRETTPQDCTTY